MTCCYLNETTWSRNGVLSVFNHVDAYEHDPGTRAILMELWAPGQSSALGAQMTLGGGELKKINK